MPRTRNRRVSIARPGPTTSSHHPGEGSETDDVTCFEAEMPPSTAMTGAPRGPAISKVMGGVWLMDSAHKAERPWLCGRGRSSLFSNYLTWLQYAANYHRVFNCFEIISRSGDWVKVVQVTTNKNGSRISGSRSSSCQAKRGASTSRPFRPEHHHRPEHQNQQAPSSRRLSLPS
jgi:hypothetical protein